MTYISPEQYLNELTGNLEEQLMDLAILKQKAIKEALYPDASKFRDIEKLTLELLQKLASAKERWERTYDCGGRI